MRYFIITVLAFTLMSCYKITPSSIKVSQTSQTPTMLRNYPAEDSIIGFGFWGDAYIRHARVYTAHDTAITVPWRQLKSHDRLFEFHDTWKSFKDSIGKKVGTGFGEALTIYHHGGTRNWEITSIQNTYYNGRIVSIDTTFEYLEVSQEITATFPLWVINLLPNDTTYY